PPLPTSPVVSLIPPLGLSGPTLSSTARWLHTMLRATLFQVRVRGTFPAPGRDHGWRCPSLDPGRRARRPDDVRRIGVMQALNRHVERVFDRTRKEHHWGKRKLARDR